MPLVFSYGSLQEAGVQLATFGRRLEGTGDALRRWTRSRVPVGERGARRTGKTHHANLIPCADSTIDGMAFEVSDDELLLTDAYEQHAGYVRQQVRLIS